MRQYRAALLADTPADASPTAAVLIERGLSDAGLRCRSLPANDPLLSGAYAVLDPEAYAVWVSADTAPEMFAVFVAHELAHFHLHENGDPCHCDEADFADSDSLAAIGYGPRQRRETEANVWAREFLLPAASAQQLFRDGKQDAHAIAARFGLPLGLVFSQLTEGMSIPALPVSPLPSPPAAGTPSAPLDHSQADAAYADHGPLLVGAGPGTGKTRTLTARVLYLTREREVPAEHILALTFSRKAAEEMRERIASADPDVGRRAAISTFHAYGFDLLRRHGAAAGLPPNPTLLDPADACALLERNVGSLRLTVLRYLHDPAYPLPDILKMISRAKEDLITPDMFARQVAASDDEKLADVARVYAEYERLLRKKGALDFSDLVCRALWLLRENAAVRAAEQARWRHILVDEYQDVNRAGALLVQALSSAEDGAGLWAVGDLRQAIYRFRGASPANVTRFQTDFPNGMRTELAVNYRSRPALVRLFGHVSGEGEAAWAPARDDDTSGIAAASLAVADDDRAQADGIARKMQMFHAEGYAYGDQVALCRTHGQARVLRAGLTARGIPVAPGPDENSPLSSRDVRDLIALLARACEPSSPARYRFADLPRSLLAVVARGGDAYDFWAEALWGEPGRARSIENPGAVVALLTLARSFRDRAAVILEPDDDLRRAFLQHVRRMLRLGTPFAAEPTEADSDTVRVLTVHASKGLEFPVVFVPNLSAGKFPPQAMGSLLPALPEADDAVETPPEESAHAEEERLFFVALTRARDHLVLSRAVKYNNRSAKPSPLLTNVETAPELRHEVWESSASFDEAVTTDEVGEAGIDLDADEERLPIDSRDADLYLRCPRRYYYQSVLALPTGERTPYSSFKSAVSAALAAVDASAALDDAWAARGPDDTHPHADFYRQAAEEIVARTGASQPTREEVVNLLTLALEEGLISVTPDAAATNGEGDVLECRTFGKPPAADALSVPADRRHSLLLAASEAKGAPATVQMRYVRSGVVLPVAEKPKQRAKFLDEYNRALRGIRLRVFTATPVEASECAGCPYLFICPD